MSYLTTKKIYPGNWNEDLNGWYQNVATGDGTTGSYAGPTSVLAQPGYRFFQFMGYVPVISGSASPITSADVIVPSPYQNDSTRPNITGMVVSGSATRPAYVYRAAISVPSGWDGRVASGIYTNTATHVISFGLDNGGSPTAASGEPICQANIASNASAFIAAPSQGLSSVPFLTATGAAGNAITNCYRQLTAASTFKVFSKATANSTTVAGNFFISDADVAANKTGYVFVEVCFIQPDTALEYSSLAGYLPNQQDPRGSA